MGGQAGEADGRWPPMPSAAVAGDMAYSSRVNRAHLHRHNIKAVIPEKGDQVAHRKKKRSAGGRPVSHDATLHKERNTVGRAINELKEWRGLVTRYGRTPESCAAGLHLRGTILWLRGLPTTSWSGLRTGPNSSAE